MVKWTINFETRKDTAAGYYTRAYATMGQGIRICEGSKAYHDSGTHTEKFLKQIQMSLEDVLIDGAERAALEDDK
jgi:hypothetical protein